MAFTLQVVIGSGIEPFLDLGGGSLQFPKILVECKGKQ